MCNRPAVSIITTSAFVAFAEASVSKATEAGSEPIFCFIIGTSTLPAQTSNCSIAAALKVSAAPKTTDFPACLKLYASFPMVVVFPTPFTPTTIITYGPSVSGSSKLEISVELFSSRSAAISSFNIDFNSLTPKYLSKETRSSIRLIILSVVSTPTSEVIKTSSRLSRTSSSTFDLPTTARPNFLNTLSFVFKSPSSRFSFFLLLKPPNNAIIFKNLMSFCNLPTLNLIILQHKITKKAFTIDESFF